MNLTGLLPTFLAAPAATDWLAALQDPTPNSFALGLPRAARAPVIAAVAAHLQRPVIVLAGRTEHANRLLDELPAWLPASRVLPFPEPNPLFYEFDAWTPATIQGRLGALKALVALEKQAATPFILVASARALMTRTLPKRDFVANTRTLKVGQSVRLAKLLEAWVGAGYLPDNIVVQPGQFSQRGGLLDIFPLGAERPVRIEFFGDEVETLRVFDPATQRSGDPLPSINIPPAREALPKFRTETLTATSSTLLPETHLEFQLPVMFPPASVLEYLPPNAVVLVDDWQELADTVQEFEEQAWQLHSEQVEAGVIPPDFPTPYFTWSELNDELLHHHPPTVLSLPPDPDWPTLALGAHFHPGPRFGGQLRPWIETLTKQLAEGEAAVILSRQAQRLAEMWNEHERPEAVVVPQDDVLTLPAAAQVVFVQGALTEGYLLTSADASRPRLHLLTDTEIFGWSRPEYRRRRERATTVAPEANYADFNTEDFVVHVDFGIGRFRGLVQRNIEGLEREYLLLEYAENDELYVPIHQADRLTRYLGVDDSPPKLSRLGTVDWSTTKTRAQQATWIVAQDLLELYAKREAAAGHALSTDSHWQQELEASFPYVETEDQLRAIREVKADLERARPMDRLICGDVGYGKTEVALRAAFKAVMDGSQVAVLVPTTVLAQQHFHTFQQRLAPYPVQVEMLSRFRSPAESREIMEKLAQGSLDIVIGTHRLLQKDVQFKNLGLVIIDEEQRFGVTHKEYLKKLRTEVHVLTLTATPIPRTLYLSLTGVRDISTINTPPAERLPIITHTGPYQDKIARQAILRELDRDGQVFYVHNRVQSIEIIRRKLEALVPEAKVGVAHGQMDEHQLSKVMDEFSAGEINVLLCTSIIESGLDIPNANTLMVERADTFGLAQLYQLRGRVGRSAARAYAYFFTDTRHRPTEEGRERLATLSEQTDLGAGYNIAMRDLEMRGAGDILGNRQHGQIAAVGFHLYTRLLADAVRRLKNRNPAAPEPPMPDISLLAADLTLINVELPLSTAIPATYVPDQTLRLRLYRRLADIRREEDVENFAAELLERFGPRPPAVEDLLYQLRVKARALRANVTAITGENGQIVITLPPSAEMAYRTAGLPAEVRVSKHRVWLPKPSEKQPQAWRELLLRVLDGLGEG